MVTSDYVWAKIISYQEEHLNAVTVSACFDDAEVVELIPYGCTKLRMTILPFVK